MPGRLRCENRSRTERWRGSALWQGWGCVVSREGEEWLNARLLESRQSGIVLHLPRAIHICVCVYYFFKYIEIFLYFLKRPRPHKYPTLLPRLPQPLPGIPLPLSMVFPLIDEYLESRRPLPVSIVIRRCGSAISLVGYWACYTPVWLGLP